MSGRRGLATGVLLVAVPVLLVLMTCGGGIDWLTPGRLLAALRGELTGTELALVRLRWWKAATTAVVGASLALSGALLQGLFRNGLASPSLVGISGGANLASSAALLGLTRVTALAGAAPVLVPVAGFIGALGAGSLVATLARRNGRLSIPTLLLTGLAVNAFLAGLLAALQSLSLAQPDILRELLSLSFGKLDDRNGGHALTGLVGLVVGLLVLPFVARSLDLLQAGEEDAASLGVDVPRVQATCLAAACLAASCAVAVAHQVPFVGLMVPHLLRRLVGPGQHVLWLAAPAGAVFLLLTELVQVRVFGLGVLQPGVVLSLLGGPFFLLLLREQGRELRSW